MKVRCPHCRIRGDVAVTLAGRVVRCPQCLSSFRVPLPQRPSEELAAAPHPEATGPRQRLDSRAAAADESAGADQETVGAMTASLSDNDFGPGTEPQSHTAQQTSVVPETGDELDPAVTPLAASGDTVTVAREEAVGGAPDSTIIDKQQTDDAAADFPDLSEQSVAWEDVPADIPDEVAAADEQSGDRDSPEASAETEEKLQEELAALLAETCIVCGKPLAKASAGDEDGQAGRCEDCRGDADVGETNPASVPGSDDATPPVPVAPAESLPRTGYSPDGTFSVTTILKAAWTMVTGVKGPVWIGALLLGAGLVGLEAAATALAPVAGAFGGETLVVWLQIVMQAAGMVLSLTFLAGLSAIGVRRSCGGHYSWRTVFSGFACIGRIAVAGMLMSLLIVSGFVLLLLPGIYLAVGYSLTLPLMVVKQYGPWEAMEASRRYIHPRWWQVFGIYILMYLIYVLSCIPLGVGLIWTVPMVFTLTGVLYRSLVPEHACD